MALLQAADGETLSHHSMAMERACFRGLGGRGVLEHGCGLRCWAAPLSRERAGRHPARVTRADKFSGILSNQYEDQYDAVISTTNDASRISELHVG